MVIPRGLNVDGKTVSENVSEMRSLLRSNEYDTTSGGVESTV